jgi:hypothetical protein
MKVLNRGESMEHQNDAVQDKKVDIRNDEEKVEFDLSVRDFDVSTNYLETQEDLDEKMIMYIEKQVRGSYEYRAYVQYMKEELDLTKCALLPNIDIKTTPVSLEFHHFPFTLFDITSIVGKSMINETNGKVSTFDISEQIMKEHFENNIGLVPLTETLHEMAHNGAVAIPFDKINGKYENFIEKYRKHIEDDFIERLESLKRYNNSDEAKKFNEFKLKKRIANYNVNYNREEDNEEEI